MTNIESTQQLVRYATKAQIVKLRRKQAITQSQLKTLVGFKGDDPAFARALQAPDDELLRRLDEVIIALDPDMARTGGLSGLAVRLRRMGTRESLTARVPPTWTAELLAASPIDEFGVLTKASATLSMFLNVPENAAEVSKQYGPQLRDIVDRLILIGASPPTPRNVDALILLGSIAGHAFDLVANQLEVELREPLGFRVWRAITTVVLLNQDKATNYLKVWVQEQIESAEGLRTRSLFPARSLDLELATVIPSDWSPPEDDWVGNALRARAENPEATVRERGTAALGLWERALKCDTLYRIEITRYLGELIGRFRLEADRFRSQEEKEQDVALGLLWVADTLQHNIDTGEAVCNHWPDSEEPCLRVTQDATAILVDLPNDIVLATKKLVEHAVLQNAGVYRREAIDALHAGGWTEEIAHAFGRVLTHPDAEPWLRCRALFALGFLQERGQHAELILKRAFLAAKKRLEDSPSSLTPRGAISEMHAALFAIGDCFGATGAEQQAQNLRERLNNDLEQLLEWSHTKPSWYSVGRGAAYVVMVTAQTGDGKSHEMLRSLQDHPDSATKHLANWAIRHRFDEKGQVRPLHAAR